MHLLKVSTAATVLVGPVLDSSGAVYTGASIADFQLVKNGTSAALASPATATHDTNGYYLIALATGNTNTLGRAAISCNKSTYAMPVARFSVVPAATYDALITNGIPDRDKLLAYVQLICRNDTALSTDRATELAEINANQGTGTGNYFPFQEALQVLQGIAGNVSAVLNDTGGIDGVNLNAAAQASITAITDLLESSKVIDTTTDPWEVVFLRKGTGGLGTGVELLRQSLSNVDGDGITSTDEVIGGSVA